MIKIGTIENLFWSNGSWEKPNGIPDISEFQIHENLLPDWLDAKRTGTIILAGEDWNYAFCEDAYYFLQRTQLLDRDNNVYLYTLIKDLWVNWIERGVKVKGYCSRTNNTKLVLDNLDYVEPTIDNPCRLYRINLSDQFKKKWYEGVDLRKPIKQKEQFRQPTITTEEWYDFIEDIKASPEHREEFGSTEKQYQRGVWIIGEAEVKSEVSRWKTEVYDKLMWLIENKDRYVLSKVTQLGNVKFKNKYCLTPSDLGGIGILEETASVRRLDFSQLYDIVLDEKFRDQSEKISKPFEKENLDYQTLKSTHGSTIDEADRARHTKIRVLQRKVYFPYPRESWVTNDNYLFRGYLDDSKKSAVHAESIQGGYSELSPFVPIYQGCYAQGVKIKNDNKNYWLSWTNQLNCAFNFTFLENTVRQSATFLNGRIPYASDSNPPEFGFLLFNFLKDRKKWNWWHYTSDDAILQIPVLTGLKTGWEVPSITSNDRTTGNWAVEINKWNGAFSLLNSLYPLAWLYYYTAFQDNKIILRGDNNWNKWAQESGFLGYSKKYDLQIDVSAAGPINQFTRNIEGQLLDAKHIDKVRVDFFNKKGIFELLRPYTLIKKDDIFFSDLQAFWEELDSVPRDFKYRPELSWYLDTNKDHLKNKRDYKTKTESNKLVCYFDGNLQQFCIGIYNTYLITHSLSKNEDNSIEKIQFRENNANTTLSTKATENGVTSKEVLYHHIQPIRIYEEHRIDYSSKAVFEQWAKTTDGNLQLEYIDLLIKQVSGEGGPMDYGTQGWGYKVFGTRTTLSTSVEQMKYLFGLNHMTLRGLPRLPNNSFDYEAIWNLFNNSGSFNIGSDPSDKTDNVFINLWEKGFPQWNSYVWRGFEYLGYGLQGIGGLLTGRGFSLTDDTARHEIQQNSSTIIRFYDGRKRYWLIEPSQDRRILEIARRIKLCLDNKHKLPIINNFQFKDTNTLINNLNTDNFQKSIFRDLGLLSDNNLIIKEDINIINKLFILRGTAYSLYIDQNKIPHLIFDHSAVKTDLQLTQRKTFGVIEGETPQQDLIDLVNQQTSVQVVTTQYPLQERIVFANMPRTTIDEEHSGQSNFSISIEKFDVEGKINPSEYYIVQYQGARQLIDVKLAVPKKQLKEFTEKDLVAIEQLNLERERWREDFRERNAFFQQQRDLELKELRHKADRIHYEEAFKIGQTVMGGVKTGAGILGLFAGKYWTKNTKKVGDALKFQPKGNYLAAKKAFGYFGNPNTVGGKFAKQNSGTAIQAGIQRLSQAYHNLGILDVQKSELQDKLEFAIAETEHKNYELDQEHHYRERELALKLMSMSNVYEQGEVTDRDINDHYNEKYGLSEVHLIYRVPSTVQREGLERYYQLYGLECQIPDVEFTIGKNLKAGEIWAFAYLAEIHNLFKFEEKELLKGILGNGIKVLELLKKIPIPLAERVVSWEEKMGALLQEASDHQREVLFNKLKLGVNQKEIIKQLAEEVPDKESLIPILAPLFNKDKLASNILARATKEEKENIIFDLVDSIDHTDVLNHLLEKEDKEKIIEKWADEHPKVANVLWDKFSHITISKVNHDEAIQNKDSIIAGREKQLVNLNKAIAASSSKVSSLEQDLEQAQKRVISLNKDTIAWKKEKANLEKSLSNTRETLNTTKLNTEKIQAQLTSKNEEIVSLQKQNKETGDINRDLLEKKNNLEKQNEELSSKLSEFSQYRAQRDELLDEVKDLKKKLFDTEQSLAAVREIEANLKTTASDTTFNQLTRYLKIPLLNLTHSSYSSQKAPYQVVDYYGSLKIVYFDETKFCYIIDDSLALWVYNSYKLLTLSKSNPNSNWHSYYLNNWPSYFGHKISSTTDFKNKVGNANIEYRSGRTNSFDFLGPVPVHWWMLAGYGSNHPFFFSYEPMSDDSNLSVYCYTNSKMSGYSKNSNSEYIIPLNTYGRYLAYFGLWYDWNQEGYSAKLKVLTKSKAKEVYSKIEGLDVDYILETYFS